MIALLLAAALASPGRATAGVSLGGSPQGGPLLSRLSLDYGFSRYLSPVIEAGTRPDAPGWVVGLGPQLGIETRWLRAGLVAMPELSTQGQVQARGGARLSWLAFWGLSFTGRADLVWGAGGRGPLELGAGLSVRL